MSNVIDAIRNATADDLAEIDQRISDLTGELESLKAARKIIDTRINGKTERTSGEKPARISSEDLAQKVFDCVTTNGPGTPRAIALKLGVTPIAVGKAAAKSGWFEKDEHGRLLVATT